MQLLFLHKREPTDMDHVNTILEPSTKMELIHTEYGTLEYETKIWNSSSKNFYEVRMLQKERRIYIL